MWTNIFKIGELQTVSWFQFLPIEPDPSTTSDRSSKAEQKDALNYIVLSAYLRLQSEGFLCTWTNSFVGPWDPSQGEHNPDEKIKLWLFLPGRQSSVPEMTQSAISKLRVVSNGLWTAPGNSEEIAAALSQALQNSLERYSIVVDAFVGRTYQRRKRLSSKIASAGELPAEAAELEPDSGDVRGTDTAAGQET